MSSGSRADSAELPLKSDSGRAQGLLVRFGGDADDGAVRTIEVSARGRVQKALLENDQHAVGAGEITPLVHLPWPDPQPGAWLEVVAGEVDSLPQPAALQGDKVMEVGAQGPHEVGTHAVLGPRAQVGEGHHLESRGQADRSGEANLRYLGDVSHFDHLLSRAYPGAADTGA